MNLLRGGDERILVEERHWLIEFTRKVIRQLREAMSDFDSKWRSTSEEATDDALSLIHVSYHIQKHFLPDEYYDYPECLESWFR